MKIRIFLLFYFAFFSSDLFSENLGLLEEYKLLHLDLSNFKTFGYKSYFNNKSNKAEAKINNLQGSLRRAKSRFSCGIVGFGFFKIKLSNGRIGYSRQCDLKVSKDRELINKQYSFFDKITIPHESDSITFRILFDRSISIKTSKNEELIIGKLKTYKINPKLLEYYKEGIYLPKSNEVIKDEELQDDQIFTSHIELSNCDLFPVLLRMYFILMTVNEKQIPNIEFKKELIRMQIMKIANENNQSKNEVTDESDENIIEHLDSAENQRLIFLENILPFIKHDY
ncbi:hypothetical protein [Leptospira barantonii]|uniref:Flagellar hook protein FlgE/F/G-like D1 domain-containing protein n=1 Tax=Leptospira barantonii TaxID=2023184 RepID=A0ABX4NK92_9LEPT|nr:hypothetical protein [Leptospira barantonii]PJZ57230.1 hypothetical protein CH367_10885 [Leptospira barantonii]